MAAQRPTAPGVQTCRLSLDLDGIAAPVLVRRHPAARRMSLRIAADGEAVVVIIPARKRFEDGLGLAREHVRWIRDRLAALPPRVPFADGALLPVLGREHRIRHAPERRAGVVREAATIVVGGDAADVSRRVESWLRSEARDAVSTAAEEKAERLGRTVRRIAIRDTCSRWGSCAADGSLSFSWRLVLAPPAVLDYVVAHEVAHLLERGHGPGFWSVVARLSPDPRDGRAWLQRHGQTLFRYG